MEISRLEETHAAEKKELEDNLTYRDVEMYRLEAALRSVSAEVVARDAKLLALSTYATGPSFGRKSMNKSE